MKFLVLGPSQECQLSSRKGTLARIGFQRRPPAAPSPQGQKSYFFFFPAFFLLAGIVKSPPSHESL